MIHHNPIAILSDVLLPGDETTGWPPASRVVSMSDWIERSDRPQILEKLAACVAACPISEQLVLIAEFEDSERSTFEVLLGALTDLYYTSPEVVAITEKMAAAGPQKPEPFDPTLLEGVINRQAGKRRL